MHDAVVGASLRALCRWGENNITEQPRNMTLVCFFCMQSLIFMHINLHGIDYYLHVLVHIYTYMYNYVNVLYSYSTALVA